MPLNSGPFGAPVQKRLCFSEIQTEQVFSTNAVFDEGLLDNFARLSGDFGPVHTSRAAAEELGYRHRLVYGFLVSLQASRLVGNEMQGAIIASFSVDFVKPVFCGDTIHLSATVVQIQPAAPAIVLKLRYTREDELVARGKVIVSFPWEIESKVRP